MLTQALENIAFQKGASLGLRHIARPDLAGLARTHPALTAQIRREFQLAPPLTLHSAAPDLLAAYWHATREAYVVGHTGRALRELVAATVSTLNTCPYCVTVHTGMFAATGAGDLGDESALTPEMRAARGWAAATQSPGTDAVDHPAFPKALIPQVFGTAVVFHYTNRMVSLFLEDSPIPLPGMTTGLGTTITRKAMAAMSKRIARHAAVPGQAAERRPADLPDAFRWAAGNSQVAAGLADFARAAEAAGNAALPAPVRALVTDHLSAWQGEAAPLSRAWVDDAVAGLDPAQRPAARLALLTARAPWQIDDPIVAKFRAAHADDRTLVQAAGWAAFAAARTIAGWFPSPS